MAPTPAWCEFGLAILNRLWLDSQEEAPTTELFTPQDYSGLPSSSTVSWSEIQAAEIQAAADQPMILAAWWESGLCQSSHDFSCLVAQLSDGLTVHILHLGRFQKYILRKLVDFSINGWVGCQESIKIKEVIFSIQFFQFLCFPILKFCKFCPSRPRWVVGIKP